MKRSDLRLTQTVVENAVHGPKRVVISDAQIPGFRLVITKTGKKSFYFRYRVGGGRGSTIREPKIADWPAMKTEAARRIAGDWHAIVRQGGDPSLTRQEGRRAPTMSDLFVRYMDDHARPKKKASSVKVTCPRNLGPF